MNDPAPPSRNAVRVEIAGEEYTLRTDADEAYALRCAAYVDERMRAIGAGSGMDVKKMAIMAALSLSDELLQERKRFRDRSLELATRLREALDEASSGSEPR